MIFCMTYFLIFLHVIMTFFQILFHGSSVNQSNFPFYQLFISTIHIIRRLDAKDHAHLRACLHCDEKLRGLAAGFPAAEASSNQLCWPRKSKGLRLLAVSLALLSLFRLLRWWVLSHPLRGLPERIPLFFSLSFLRLSARLLTIPAYLCPSLHFQLCSVSTHRNSVRIQRVDTMVQLKSGSDRKLQYSGSCIEKRRPEASERYRQTLRDRINRMESKIVECFW